MIFNTINKHKRAVRFFAAFLAFNLFVELVMPLRALALTGGPSQPEVQSFEPVSANQMVDPFTGDFTYNIPLLDVGGYPINISYHAAPTADEEASWVGLGWNINPGVINRNMRGIPDDFNGEDKIKKTLHMKNNWEVEFRGMANSEVFGYKAGRISFGYGINYNSYKGFGYTLVPIKFSNPYSKGPFQYGVGIELDSKSGIDLDMNIGYKMNRDANDRKRAYGLSVSNGINSRYGLKALTLSPSFSKGNCNWKMGKEKEGRRGANGSASFSFANPSYSPSSSPDFYTLGLSLGLSLDPKYIQGVDPAGEIRLNFSINGIKNNGVAVDYPAYGFLYNNKAHEKIKHKEKALMDFNRDRESQLNKFTKLLPTSYNTFDVLSVSGQGVSGVYRPHYSSVGMVADPHSKTSFNPNIGASLELGSGGSVKFGGDANLSFMSAESGSWDKDNDAYDYVNFATTSSNIDFEPAYYKNAGEKVRNDEDFYYKMRWYEPIEWDMDERTAKTKLTKNAQTSNGTNISLTTGIKRQKREKRNQVISYLTFAECEQYGLTYNSSQNLSSTRDNNIQKPHHIGEYTVVNPDGSRYVYGVPAYNNKQKEVSFNIPDGSGNSCSGLANYFNVSTASPSNSYGIDNYFSSEETPPYAHSYLLSGVLSPDYIDVNGDGPTPDDFGNYTAINYKRVYNDYKWRTPYTTALYYGNYQKGYNSDKTDDKGNYVYGEKEVWYTQTIKTKTHIAVFYTSKRQDGLAAYNESGAKDASTKTLHKLDSIMLYTLDDYQYNGVDAIPIKTVIFDYDYSLCWGVKNNTGAVVSVNGVNINLKKGKLTLKSIKFKYGKSFGASFSPYLFSYNEASATDNPSYYYKSYDRWGTYKPASSCPTPTTDEFPYVDQDSRETKADVYAAVWSLREITLPSGGKIQITYEADDYAYVQDKEAMQMTVVNGVAKNGTDTYGDELYSGKVNNNFIFFNYTDNGNGAFTADSIKKFYWKWDFQKNEPIDKYIYYSFFTSLTKTGDYEPVTGYAQVVDFGIKSPGIAWVRIKEEDLNDRSGAASISPISKMAWNYARLNLPHLVYPGSTLNRKATMADLFFFVPELVRMVEGYERSCHSAERGKKFVPAQSWIRLVSPKRKKVGGGYRVKMIKLVDQWKELNNNASSEDNATLGQVYSYTKYDPVLKMEISSGVASYEPLIGGDENPFRYSNNGVETQRVNRFTPLNLEYHDIPVGEALYPGASVGYSRVTVRNLKPADLGLSEEITRHATGYTVQEFYTAKDFPVKTNQTPLEVDIKRFPLLKLIGFSFERVAASQGFSIELNDMHGKLKAQYVYNENGVRQSGTEYYYKVDNEAASTLHLDNKVSVLNKGGTIENDVTLGVEIETLFDPQHKQEKTHAGSFDANMNGISLGAIPFLPILTFGLTYSYHETDIRTATITKVINRYGLVDRVVAYDQDATITSKNVAWDGETGEVLLTQTQNEYNDYIYNLSYPAHWVYDGMGHAYKNIGISFNASPIVSGAASVSNELGELLYPGDELIVESYTFLTTPPSVNPTKLWVLDKIQNTSNYTVTFIQKDGSKAPDGNYSLKVMRSGRRNMQSTNIASVVSKSNPLNLSTNSFGEKTDFSSVINSSAVAFSNQWQTYSYTPGCWFASCPNNSSVAPLETCPPVNAFDVRTNIIGSNSTTNIYGNVLFPAFGEKLNPFVWGIWGNWRPEKSYVYYDRNDASSARSQTIVGVTNDLNTTFAKNDGVIQDFEPFWRPAAGGWVDIENVVGGVANNPWVWNSTVTQTNPDGFEVENKDALNIYSSAQYSYLNKLPVAVANNAKLNEIVFENFEDYFNNVPDYIECQNWHTPTTWFSLLVDNSLSDNSRKKERIASATMHWYMWPDFKNFGNDKAAYVTNETSHTGYRCLKLLTDTLNIPVRTNPVTTTNNTDPLLFQYDVNSQDFVSIFAPKTNKEYLISYWEKITDGFGALELYVPSTSSAIALTPTGTFTKVEGWIRKEYKFQLPNTVSYFEVKIINYTVSGISPSPSYFDDIRIFPIDGNMKSFVYDNNNMRLMAELDENNYATFFEYDTEGNLIRTKKETERGIITLSENRQNIQR